MNSIKNDYNENIYFTIIPTAVSGFTDKLNQFNGLYRLGRDLGFKYYHTEFKSHRSSFSYINYSPTTFSKLSIILQKIQRLLILKISRRIKFDIFDYLGFNQYLKQKSSIIDFNETKKIIIEFDSNIQHIHNLNSLTSIKQYINSKIIINDRSKKLIMFKVKKGRGFLTPIFRELPPHSELIGLRKKYYELKKRNNWNSKFENRNLKILVHIRLGDTAVIKTPWNKYISMPLLMFENRFEELDSIVTNRENLDIINFKSFIEEFYSHNSNTNISALIFSDGFKRAFSMIYKNKDKFNFSKHKLKLLMDAEKKYYKNYFNTLEGIENSKLVIGEEKNKLYDLIHSIFEADVIVISNRQNMIPKFISAYFELIDMPVIIVLYHDNLPNYVFVSKEVVDNKFIFVNVNDSDYKKVFSRLDKLLSERITS